MVFFSLMGGLAGAVLFVAFLQWVLSGRETSEIIRTILLVVSALFLTIFLAHSLISAINRWDKAVKRNREKRIQSELDLEPINKNEFYARFIDWDRFYFWFPRSYNPSHIFHGKYNGYEMCILADCHGPMAWSHDHPRNPKTAIVHIKSSSFNFPKFLITNNWRGRFSVKGNQSAQMFFAGQHILDFFNQNRRFAAQGNGNEFMFFKRDFDPKSSEDYRLLIKNAFNVLRLLSNVEIPSHVSEYEIGYEITTEKQIKNINSYPLNTFKGKWLLVGFAEIVSFVILVIWLLKIKLNP